MKLIVVSLALLAVSGGFQAHCSPVEPNENGNVREDLLEFQRLIPKLETEILMVKHAIWDSKYRMALLYLQSQEQRDLFEKVSKTAAAYNLMEYLNLTPTDVEKLQSEMKWFLEIDPEQFPSEVASKDAKDKGFKVFVKQAKALLDFEKIKELRDQKIQANSGYANLYEKLHSKELVSVLLQFVNSVEVLEYLQKTSVHGLNVPVYVDYLLTAYGFYLD